MIISYFIYLGYNHYFPRCLYNWSPLIPFFFLWQFNLENEFLIFYQIIHNETVNVFPVFPTDSLQVILLTIMTFFS